MPAYWSLSPAAYRSLSPAAYKAGESSPGKSLEMGQLPGHECLDPVSCLPS